MKTVPTIMFLVWLAYMTGVLVAGIGKPTDCSPTEEWFIPIIGVILFGGSFAMGYLAHSDHVKQRAP